MGNEKKNRLTGDALVSAIAAACDGLIFISETDSVVKPVFVSKKDAANIEEVVLFLGERQDPEITESSADAFFSRVTRRHEWHGDREKALVRGFKALKDLLYTNLTGLRQFRLGRTRITIFLIGTDRTGNMVGITTEAVET